MQLKFTCQAFPGINSLSRAQQPRLAPHPLTVGKHNCQRTECWERRDCLREKKKDMLDIYVYWKRNVRATKENPDVLHSHGNRLIGDSPT